MQEIEEMTQFKQSKCTLPLARIKRIMKFDEDVKVHRTLQLNDLCTLLRVLIIYQPSHNR